MVIRHSAVFMVVEFLIMKEAMKEKGVRESSQNGESHTSVQRRYSMQTRGTAHKNDSTYGAVTGMLRMRMPMMT